MFDAQTQCLQALAAICFRCEAAVRYAVQILIAANTAYFNQRYQDAAEAYVFLVDVCNVTANMERLPKCASLSTLATQKLSQMSKGFDFYGAPSHRLLSLVIIVQLQHAHMHHVQRI